MIVLHLSYFNGSCYLWGETPAKEFSSRRGRPPKKPKPRPSPFDVSPEQLQQALELAGFKNSNQTGAGMVAWMPSLPDRPLASSLVVDQPPAEREPELRPWKVTTLPLTAADVIAFLLFCDGQRQLSPALLLGPEFFVWMQILRYGASLVMRGRFLPTLKKENGTYAAAWEPVLAGEDLETVANLVNAMTAACYCLTEGPEFDTQASAVVMEFLALITNQLVRRAALSVAGIMEEGRGKGAVLGNPHQRWLAALKASAPPQLEGSLAELASLGHQIAEWQRRAYTLSAAPYRFCFRLEEPQPTEIDANNGTWTLRYLLQAREDPSFLLSTATAWSSNRKLKISGDSLAGRREFILTALGQAASLSTVIKDSMQARIPTVAELDSNSAFDFLSHQAPLLRQAGFMLMLPAWWTNQGPRTKLAVKGRASPAGFSSAASFNLDDVVSFEWQVAVGDEVLTEKELATLAELKSPLLRLRGQWVQVDVNGIQAALRFWHKKASEPLTARDLIRLSLGAADQPDHLPLDCVTGSSWLKDVLRRLQGLELSPDLPQPLLLKGELRPYQRRGYSWLKFLSEIGFGACLADDMGLGKTIQCLALFQHRWAQGLAGPALLVCPTSVIANWEKESARFTPELPLQVHHGPSRLKDKKFINMVKGKALVITSYALLGRDKDFLNQVQWDGVVLDEAQNIKNPDTLQAKAARSLPAVYRIALTGTPVENNVGDLWSLMEFLNPGLLGTKTGFKRSFLVPIQRGQNQQVAANLKRITGPFILRRLKTDRSIIKDLPRKIESKVFCSLTKEQASLYAAIVREVEAALEDGPEGIERQGIFLAALTKFKQVCNHPAQLLKDNSGLVGRSGKLIRLGEIAEEMLSTGERALIFTQFAEMGRLLHKYLMESFGYPVLFLHGGVPKKERDRMINLFQERGGPPFFVLTVKAGGTGLNLTGANHVFHFDRWWNPAVENQATDRAYRIGQEKNVQVYKFVCRGTIEEKIDEIIERKLELAESIVGSGESWLTKLTTAEFKDLMALRAEAMGDW